MKPGLNARPRLARAPTQSGCDLLRAHRIHKWAVPCGLAMVLFLEEHRPVIPVYQCSGTGGEGKKKKKSFALIFVKGSTDEGTKRWGSRERKGG